ncbi:MAG: TorF family putative porin [Nevskia sp.]|nr:TorF family putative porin [Nevskia sp.]
MRRLFLLLFLSAAAAAHGDWLSGNAGIASDYLFRGLDQTNGAAFQGGLDYARDGGLYAGGWASNNRSAGGGELDLYGGYSRQTLAFGLLPANLEAGAVGYLYSGERAHALGGGSQDFAELYAGIGAGPASLKLYVAPDYANRGGPGYTLRGSARFPLGAGFRLQLTVGYNAGRGVERQTAPLSADGAGHTYFNYALRLSRPLGNVATLWAEMAGTDLDLAQGAQGGSRQPRFLLGLRKDLDF